ncbi:hypothetical protein [Methanosarcina barkeri]|uniref:Multidrug resistance efflux pump n=1 Tax=Methanosarcina barkeri 227 TaxID=1434106 RepID=A0A0E3R307_METBA|nr:hypothetical protein [Methanosarcina barkeri]AKB58012.1 multidrug resistance efflux pump [Methanosarcina barkeri 227]
MHPGRDYHYCNCFYLFLRCDIGYNDAGNPPKNVAFASGFILGLCMGAGGIGAAVIGWTADLIGSLSDTMFLLIIPTILCLILALLVRHPAGN